VRSDVGDLAPDAWTLAPIARGDRIGPVCGS